MTSHGEPLYRERLHCPAWYWLVGLFGSMSTASAVGWYLGPAVAVGVTAAVAIAVAGFLSSLGRLKIVVDARGLWLGPSLLEWEHQGPPQPLDRRGTWERLGPGADARAYVVTRAYLVEAVEVPVVDAADPHPYWLIGTRRPAQLALALAEGRRAHGGGVAR